MDDYSNTSDIVYIRYKKIFGNIFLSNKIFQFVKDLNYNSVIKRYRPYRYNSEINEANLQNFLKSQIFSYKDITYSRIIGNGWVSLFRDKIKSNSKFEDNEPKIGIQKKLLQFIKFYSISFEEFKQFYFVNKNEFLKVEKEKSSKDTRDLFELLIDEKQFEILKFIRQDIKEDIESERQYYLKLKQQKKNEMEDHYNKYKLKIELVPDAVYPLEVTSPFCIYFNKQLLKNAIQKTSFETLYLLQDLGYDFMNYENELAIWALDSEKRNEILNYFISELKLTLPIKRYHGFIKSLEYRLYKKLAKSNEFFRSFTFEAKHFAEIVKIPAFAERLYGHLSNSNNHIQFILVVLHGSFMETKKIEYMFILKLIKKLILYNSNQSHENRITENTIKEIWNKTNQKYTQNDINQKNQRFSFTNSIFNLFVPNKPLPATLGSSYKKIDYNDFNLEREAKKIYLLEFLRIIVPEEFTESLIQFSSVFNQYHLLSEYIDFKKIDDDIVNHFTLAIFGNLDIQLYEFCLNNGIKNLDAAFIDYNKIRFGYYKNEMFDRCSNLLQVFYQNNDSLFLKLFLPFININELGNKELDILIGMYKDIKNNYKNLGMMNAADINNKSAYFYLYRNYKSLSDKWEDNFYAYEKNTNS